MSSQSSVKVTVKINDSAINLMNQKAIKGLFTMGFDMASRARVNAPYLTGALRSTIRVQEAKGNTVEVIAGGSYGGRVVNYAWKREQGPNRNPATEHYMQKAMESIMSGNYIQKYFKDITR